MSLTTTQEMTRKYVTDATVSSRTMSGAARKLLAVPVKWENSWFGAPTVTKYVLWQRDNVVPLFSISI